MIKLDDNGMVVHTELDKEEATVFIAFLQAECNRHEIDIGNIRETINYLKNKFELEQK